MTDLRNVAARAVESPIAAPPERQAIEQLVGRRRRRRRAQRLVCSLVVTVVVAIGTVAVLHDDHNAGRVAVVLSPTTRPAPTPPDDARYGVDNLVQELKRAGMTIRDNGTTPGNPIGADAKLLCVGHTEMRVYKYPDRATRLDISNSISRDGSSISRPVGDGTTRVEIVEWIGPPHFFARGRIIVLVLANDAPLLHALTQILGPTLSPNVVDGRTAMTPCDARR
jgi:hypothetical protein